MRVESRVLVCRGGALGDLLLTFPALKAVRRHWPQATIVLAAYPPQSRLALLGGWVDDLFSLDSAGAAEWFAADPSLSPAQVEFLHSFDLAISFLHDPEGHVAGHFRQAGIRRLVVCSPSVGNVHAIDHFVSALDQLGVQRSAGEGAELNLPDACAREGAARVEAWGGNVMAIHPGSGSPRKNWPVERFAQLAEAIMATKRARPVFVLGDAEANLEERLTVLAPGVQQARGLDLIQLAGVLKSCCAYIGNDSGVTHLAAALRVPVIALFSSTRPETWAPRGGHVQVIDASDPTLTIERLCLCLEPFLSVTPS